MNIKKIITVLIVIVMAMVCFAGCGDNDPSGDTGNNDPSYNVVTDSEAHYLIFMVENIEIEKMLVVSTDTYDSLKDYFPAIPEKEGFMRYWEEKPVYSETEKEIYINSYDVRTK